MVKDYWIYDWAKLRQDEVIRIPQEYRIHPDFIENIRQEDFMRTFEFVNSMFMQIYGDIAESPDAFGMPLHHRDKYRFFSQQWRDSGQAPYRPAALLYNLLISGEIDGHAVKISLSRFNNSNTVKNIHFIFERLEQYSFCFRGLKNHRLYEENIYITYPADRKVLVILKLMADKAHNTGRFGDFLCCHFRLFQDDINTAGYGFGADDIADRVLTNAEKAFVYKMDETLLSIGMFRKSYGGYECHGLAYYDSEKVMVNKGPYLFRMVSRSPDIVSSVSETNKLFLLLRIRNVERCIDYLRHCPESVRDIFRQSDTGCVNRPCGKGVAYEFEGQPYWRCACCAPAFRVKPQIEDIPHYIKLVEIGATKGNIRDYKE